MVRNFVEFVKNWEEAADKDNFKLIKVTDNSCFDAYFISRLIEKYYPGKYPLPYKMTTQTYSSVLEVKGYIRGFMNARWPNEEPYAQRMREIYDLPVCKVEHDHRPDRDAENIAYKYLWYLSACKIEKENISKT